MKLLTVAISLQHLHHLFSHGVLPESVGGAYAWRLAFTSRSLRFFGLLNAMSGGFQGRN